MIQIEVDYLNEDLFCEIELSLTLKYKYMYD